MHHELPPQEGLRPRKKFLPQISIPRWFRKFLFFWAAVILTIAAVGYGLYTFSGEWTPAHMIELFKLGL